MRKKENILRCDKLNFCNFAKRTILNYFVVLKLMHRDSKTIKSKIAPQTISEFCHFVSRIIKVKSSKYLLFYGRHFKAFSPCLWKKIEFCLDSLHVSFPIFPNLAANKKIAFQLVWDALTSVMWWDIGGFLLHPKSLSFSIKFTSTNDWIGLPYKFNSQ